MSSRDRRTGKTGGKTEIDVLWQAVVERDRRYDGVLYYGVTTTGVFCRPVCPSRRPHPEHVEFFHRAADARRRGYRPCKRCRPELGTSRDPDRRRIVAACRAIEGAPDHRLTLPALASALGLSPDRTRQLFRRTLGVTPKQYSDALRLARFKHSIAAGDSVAEATYAAGFGSSSRLYERAGERLGMTPASYRRGGPGEHVRYTSWRSPLGVVLLAATAKGVCSVKLGPPETELLAELAHELPGASLERSDDTLAELARPLAAYLEGTGALPALPLDVVGTAFQARVWAALAAIPTGETRTYTEVAAAIGAPRAVRAVAGACARNPVALVVPCHRVLPKGGRPDAPGGYRWGTRLKAALLALEAEPGG